MIMTASTFTAEDLQDLPRHLKGNLCRCTGYHAIEDAIHGVRTVEVDQPGAAVGYGVGPQPVPRSSPARRATPSTPRWRGCCT